MKRHVGSNRGFSMVEGLVVVGIVAVSALAIGTIIAQNGKVTRVAQSKQEMPGVSNDVLNRARAVLLDTKHPTSGRAVNGICSLLVPEEIRPGTVPVNLILTKGVAPKTSWEKAFAPDWTVQSFKDLPGGKVQLVLKGSKTNPLATTSSIELDSLKVHVDVTVRSMDPSDSKGMFAELKSDLRQIDAKRAVYMLESKTTFNVLGENGQKNAREVLAKDMVSVLDVGACDIMGGSVSYKLSPAGTGLGDPEGKTIYNNTEYKQTGVNIFEITASALEVTQGRYIGGKLSADRTRNAVSACSEVTYRCPKSGGTRQYKDFVNYSAAVTFNARNQYSTTRSRARFAPTLRFLSENGRNLGPNLDIQYTSSRAVDYRKHTDGLYYPVNENNSLDLSSPLEANSRDGLVRLFATANNAQGMCQSLCDPAAPKKAFPHLSLATPDFVDANRKWIAEESVTSAPIHCTMCYVKGCGRMGLETFGPVEEMPPEPLDAQIPECSSQEKQENAVIFPYVNENVTVADVGGTCVSAKFEGSRLVYKVRDCSANLPAMCFAFGEYTLSQSLGTRTPRNVNGNQAMEACRDLGRESHPIAEIRAGLEQQGSSTQNLGRIPVTNGRYQFLNLAKMGTFVAPQSLEEQAHAENTIKARFPNTTVGEFWVALKPFEGTLVARGPRAMTSNTAAEQHLLYYDGGGVQRHVFYDRTPANFVAAGSGAYVIFNNVKFRGLVQTADEQTDGLNFLCMKKSDHSFYISSASNTHFSGGGSACAASGGVFTAPQSPAAWMNALMMVERHNNLAPFSTDFATPRAVWVAYSGPNETPVAQGELEAVGSRVRASGGGGGGQLSDSDIHDHLVDSNGRFAAMSDVTITRTTGTPPNTQTERIPDPAVIRHVACFSLRAKQVTVHNLSQGCPSSATLINKGNIKNPAVRLLWVLNKSNFRLGNKDFIQVN